MKYEVGSFWVRKEESWDYVAPEWGDELEIMGDPRCLGGENCYPIRIGTSYYIIREGTLSTKWLPKFKPGYFSNNGCLTNGRADIRWMTQEDPSWVRVEVNWPKS